MFDIGLKAEEKDLLTRLVTALEKVTNGQIVIRIEVDDRKIDDIRK